MTRTASILGFLVAMSTASAHVSAQTGPAAAIAEARAQIDAINVDSAAALLRLALDPTSGASERQRVRAFVLLGITHLMLRREREARGAFRQALLLDPQLRVDSLADLSSDLLSVFNSERGTLPAPTVVATVLEVRGLPAGAQLRVDGTLWQTPRQQVRPGLHRIEVRARGYLPYRDSIVVREGRTAIATVTATPAVPATLSVTSEPWGTVFLDGERIGETPIVGRVVAAGTYNLVLEVVGRARLQQQLELRSGEHVRLPMLGSTARPPRSPFPFTTADSLYRAARFDDALPLYRRILGDTALALSDEQRAQAAMRLGMIHYGMARGLDTPALFDSARVYFRTVYQLAPQYTLGPAELTPELRTSVELARERALGLVVDAPTDSVVSRTSGQLRIVVRPNQPADVVLRVVAVDDGRVLHTDSQSVDGARAFTWNLRAQGDTAVAFGEHSVLIAARDSLGEAAPRIEFTLRVAREAVDTTPLPPALMSTDFLLEIESVNRSWHLGRGLLFGGIVAVGVPLFSALRFPDAQPAFDGVAFAVGGAFVLSGLIGSVSGDKTRPIYRNIERNSRRREADARERQQIADANRAALRTARIHLVMRRVR